MVQCWDDVAEGVDRVFCRSEQRHGPHQICLLAHEHAEVIEAHSELFMNVRRKGTICLRCKDHDVSFYQMAGSFGFMVSTYYRQNILLQRG